MDTITTAANRTDPFMKINELSFSWAYGFADRVVDEVRCSESGDVVLDFLETQETPFLEKVSKPFKATVLHDFIYNLNLFDFHDSTSRFPEESLISYVTLLRSAGMDCPAWLSEEEVSNHIHELDVLLERAARIVTEPTFHLLFSDREFLCDFQALVATKIKVSARLTEHTFFNKKGYIRRPSRIPSWLRRAVFYRDKGRCQNCFSDLTGTVALSPRLHLDHIRPLSQLGSNDPTNFQLLCESCNLKKGGNEQKNTFRTETYW
jgi:5-methylcytosine-specific restriction endonuclease McrA